MNKTIYIFFASIIFISASFAGGPWTQQKGVGYFKLSEWWITYDKHYTDSGELDPNITSGIYNSSFYGEYGLSDRFTTILYAPLFSRNFYNNQVSGTTGEVTLVGEAINSIGDINVSFKYGLTGPGAKFPIAATLTLGLPTGSTGGGELGILQTGDGEFNQSIQIDAGTGFQIGKTNAYFSTFAGVNNRTNGFSEEFKYGLEVGAGLFNQKLWLIARLNGVESFNNGNLGENINSTSIFADRAEYTSYGLEAAYYITKQFGISASFASAFRGKIIAAAPSYSVGVFLDLSK
ncbi:MAG: hypothetical protein ACI86M_000347 [Saprospiraceae bacterium]|jgi:hypothetical protein